MMFITKWKLLKWLVIFIVVALIVLFLIYLKFQLTGNASLEIETGNKGIISGFWDFVKDVLF